VNNAVFLDRDGTINVDKNYLHKTKDFEFISGVPDAISELNNLGYKVIVITNQSGIARGYYSETDLMALHKYIELRLAAKGAKIDAFYYCPHHPQAVLEKYRIDCNCRKPKTGLFETAITDFDIDAAKSWAIGDKMRDIEPAMALGIKSAIILTERDRAEYTSLVIPEVRNLADFVERLTTGEV
jgi:D-glycero-D-manno-heptose 1,7-bisphosphate phosphatase